jgi:sugar phosphate isomerase/epimerase
MGFKLGFKVNPFLHRHGWKPGAGADWNTAATVKELGFWHKQGYEVVEVIPDHYAREGFIFDFSDDEWVETGKVIQDSGLRVEAVLGWRRMFFREPWVKEQAAALDKIARIGELLRVKIIDISTVYPLPLVPAPGAPARPLFRSLWDATTADFEIAAKWLKQYAQRLSGFGAAIALQLHPDGLVDIPLSAFRLMEMIDEPNVGINPDTFDNQWIYPEYPASMVPSGAQQCKMVAPYVNYWHAKNWNRSLGSDGKWQFTRTHLDEGDQPTSLMVQNLVEVGFEGGVILECGRGFEYSVAPATLLRSRDYLTWLRDVYAPAVPTRKVYGPMHPENLSPSARQVTATPGT